MPNKKLKGKPDTAEMSFFDHIEELRWHLIRSLIAVLVLTVVAFIEITFIYDNIIMAPTRHTFITYEAFCKFGHWMGMGDKLCLADVKLTFQ
ncbi:MAG TPA: twin-arginine translocase subunit TatC, partial [Chitinophagaceae bacterium]|nr:twin-arginine translocase subunit TatC [Chitinophagaceae bacterium]